ncbi:NmrA family NAD(P)-binding protein [Streptosporangium soli]|nr:NAD(P)H-binding protein [Streptosporangium sp. KLBMP 9127]
MTYLVIGATGKAGWHVVDELLKAGQRVRAVTRNPGAAVFPQGVEVVKGDVGDPHALAAALEGVVGAHLLAAAGGTPTDPEIADVVRKAGVRRVTLLWNGAVGPVERAFEDSGVEWTRLEALDFMGNTGTWAEELRETGEVREPYGDVPSAFVHEADVGAVVAAVLVLGGHAGRSYALTGPEGITPRQRLAAIAEATGRRLQFVEISDAQARERLRQAGLGEADVELLTSWASQPHPGTDDVREILGREPVTFDRWAGENAKLFRAGPRPR